MKKASETTHTRRAAGYPRVSTAKQAEQGLGLEVQTKRVREYIAERGWQLVELYVERGISGMEDRRPELDRLFADAEAGRFDVLVIPAIDRLGRSARQLLESFERLERAGVEVVSLREQIDTTTAAGRMLRTVMSGVAELENDMKAERVSGSARARAERAEYPGGRYPPYGYRRTDEGLIIIRAEAEVVRRIFREATTGYSILSITRRLNNEGFRTSRGLAWRSRTVGRTLRNPIYYGGIAYKGEVVAVNEDYAILDRALWDRVQEVKGSRDNAPGVSRAGRTPKGNHLFVKGMLRCSCGYALSPRTRKGSEVYICLGRTNRGLDFCDQKPIQRAAIDQPALRYFQSIGLDVEETRKAFEAAVQRRVAQVRTMLQDAERAENAAAESFARIKADYKRGALTPESWERDFKDELTEEHKAAAAEVKRLRAQERAVLEAGELRDAEAEMLRYFAQVRAVAAGTIRDARTVEELRAVLGGLFERFLLRDVTGEEIVIGPHRPDPGLISYHLVNGRMLEIRPVPRPQAVEGYTEEGLPVKLKKVALEPPVLQEEQKVPTG